MKCNKPAVRNGDGSEGPYKQERRLGECGAATIRLDGISRLTVLLVSLSGVPRFVPEEAVTNDQGDETYCCQSIEHNIDVYIANKQ